jgi:serine/threonine protein kinase/tetratricopeptide (TPR) repeat protein
MEIFSEASLGPDGRRAAYLDRACDGDPELRAEVESLLSTRELVSNFLDAPTVSGGDLSVEGGDLPDDAFSDREPHRVGRYSIVERIGEGGFAVVYCASQNHPIRREVALKVLKLGMDTKQVIARFESERQVLARMDHPNIARIFDAGAAADGRPYFAMELVDGAPITAYCDANRLSIHERLGLFVQVCQAVQHAHQKGIIHRDLKPSNILVTQVDGAAVPKVIDFGIAKAMESGGSAHTAFTELRHFVGTPQYMSPEQAGAGDGDVDTRSDIYSLGVLLYELLTGVTPFDVETVRQPSFERVRREVREAEPLRPSTRVSAMGAAAAGAAAVRGLDGPRLRRVLARELDWVVVKAIDKDRTLRYDTAAALSDDVRRYLAYEPVVAGPPHTLHRLRLFVRRHRGPLLAATAVAVALLLGLAGTTFGLVRAKRDRARTEAALAEAEQVSRFLADMLRSANPDRARGQQLLVRDVLDRTARSLDQGKLGDRPLVEAGIRMALGSSYESLGMFAEAERQFRRSLELRQRVLGDENRETAKAILGLAGTLSAAGESRVAESLVRRGLGIQERVLGATHPETLDTHCMLAWAIWTNGDVEGAKAELSNVIGLSRGAAGAGGTAASRERLADALSKLGVVLLDTDPDGAEPLFAEALTLDRAAHGDKYRNVARNMSNLAAVRMKRGDFKAAEAFWREVLRLQRQMLPADHQDIAWTLRLLGKARAGQGDLADAERYAREGLDMERRVFRRKDHPLYAFFLNDLAEVLERGGRREEALAARRESLAIQLADRRDSAAARPSSPTHQAAVVELTFRTAGPAAARPEVDTILRLAPDEPRWWLVKACLDLYFADELAYRRTCAEMRQQFPAPAESWMKQAVAFAFAAGRPSGQDLPWLIGLTAQAPSERDGRAMLCRGLSEYRAGKLDAAEQWLRRSQAAAGEPNTAAAAACWRAAVLRRLGRAADATAALEEADAAYRKVPRAGDGDLGSDHEGWLMAQLAAREAGLALR